MADLVHVLDRGVGEQAFDVASSVQHERGEQDRDDAHADHERAGRERFRVRRKQHLEAEQRVKCDVEEQPRQHGRDGRGAFGVRIGQPGMQRRKADLGAVA